MNEKGVAIVIGTCLVLVWLFGGTPAKKVEPIPVDGLIESVASVRELTTLLPGKMGLILHSVETENHSPGVSKTVSNSSETPNSSPSPSDRHEKAKREIIIFTSKNCPPCDRWKRCEQAKFEADGWTVAYCEDHNYPLTPHFLIESSNKQTEHRGYLPFERIDEVVK
jgi:hypothetical protein